MRDKIKSYLLSLNRFNLYKQLLLGYINNYLEDERDTYNTQLVTSTSTVEDLARKNAIIVFVIRCNERISFNDELRNNDLLLIVEYISEDNFNVFTFNVTADPKSKKPNIAHLVEQVYTGNIGVHRGTLGRVCIRSDKGLWYRRTDSKGNSYEPRFEQIGINIHDNGGFFNSSLGCVILESSSEYKNVFKPLLNRVSNRNNVPVMVVNQDYFTDVLRVV